jgi:anion-transporting  ArsA/GET3 family ATPase
MNTSRSSNRSSERSNQRSSNRSSERSNERSNDMATMISEAHVLVCCGSGGVGKTTTAAAIATEAARRGRRVVLITIDPARRLADALGMTGRLGNEPVRLELPGDQDRNSHGELWAMMLDAKQTFDHLVRTQSRGPRQADEILGNPFYVNIASRLSGSQEYMAAEKLYELNDDDRFDLVVVDTPPSREALDFLDAPKRLTNFLDHRVYRWLVTPARGGLKVLNFAAQPILRTIGRVIGADVLADAVDFFRAFEGIEEGFRQRAHHVDVLLRSADTRYVVIASPRSDTVSEALYFTEQLGRAGVTTSGLVINRLQPTFGRGSAKSATANAAKAEKAGDSKLAALHRNLAHLRSVAEAEETSIAPLLSTLVDVPVARVSQRPIDVHDIVAISEIGRTILG